MEIKAELISGYHKLPIEPEWKGYCGFGMTKEEMDEYRIVARIREDFFKVCEGLISDAPRCKIYSNEFVNRFIRKFGIQNLYRDYAWNYFDHPSVQIFTSYLPYGIMGIDSAIAREIKRLGSEDCYFTYKELEECILRQMHLHPIIRNNLYSNLLAHNT
jgi:hypothetical protein